MFDTVGQYAQVLGAPVDDWHPPIMVRLWQLLHPLAGGTAPMFAVQVALYAAGFALIVGALVRSDRWRAAIATALLALSPLLLGWQMVVLKDTQMLGTLVAASGLVAHYRLASRRIPIAIAILIAILIIYSTLVRANALFATVPFAILLLKTCARSHCAVVLALATALAIASLTPLINQRLLGASGSEIAKTQPLFDLAAIAVRTPGSDSPFTAAERARMAQRHCVKAYFWDPLSEPNACAPATRRLTQELATKLYADLAQAALRHPIAYAGHRLAHWNSTERWLVDPGLPDAEPPDDNEPNEIGLAGPQNDWESEWQGAAAAEAATPLGWPIVWTLVALVLLPAAMRRRPDPAGSLAFALLVSALALELSFLIVSISSDLRYHLWPMTASALGLILLSDDIKLKRREWIAGSVILAFVLFAGLVERSTLPPAPDSYDAMITAPVG
jgi:hypothetical protein